VVDGTGHGQQYAQRLTLGAGPALFAQTLKQSQIAVTQVKCDRPTLQLSGTSMLKDAYQVGLQFRDFPVFETWIDGKALPVTAQACCGTVSNGRRISCALQGCRCPTSPGPAASPARAISRGSSAVSRESAPARGVGCRSPEATQPRHGTRRAVRICAFCSRSGGRKQAIDAETAHN